MLSAHNLCHKSAENKRQPLVKSTLTKDCCLLIRGYLVLSQIHGFGVFLNNIVPGHVVRAYMMTTTKAEI